ncbi:hypothetical protein GUITHDRAFT_132039 [Guillardia theta CCMP2712]|uniref:Uncharacterized protein n=1 Tax=Guillardia theta (strain CCMP2712) TaxID=905079 RepID=L1K165_GUITC|nr:hypothetical protein GUITHDRAFT_132039 [Guillardia theta CCMP2712]EKX54279.1 hypothetical protein GUITHDRAFT_132039 [Guillardia theta CCMP2712]|eukprot:XP_005841259.1 hypothetical protein GUITHDRAFT_132039 [Guillardia theta CCMP2712]
MRKEDIAKQYEIHKLEIDWKDDTWIAFLTSCCTVSTILSVIVFSFISFRDPVADARVDCILIWETNATNYNYTKSFFPEISHYQGTNRFYLFLKQIWQLGQETRLRCKIGWALLGFDALLGTIIFMSMLFRTRAVLENRSDVDSISGDLTKSLTELKMKHKRVRYSCTLCPLRAQGCKSVAGLDLFLDLAVLVMWAHGGHRWWFVLSLFFQILSWRFYVVAYWWWASKVSAPLSVGRGMLLWLPVIGPSVAAFTAGFGALDIDKFGFCHGASLADMMSIDEHERLEFLDDVAHRSLTAVKIVIQELTIWNLSPELSRLCEIHARRNICELPSCHETGEALCMAVFTGNLVAARAALALGASPDYASSRGAWANNRVDIVQVDGKRKGTTVQVRKRRAFFALEIAMRKKDLAMAGLLLQNGAKVPKEVLMQFRGDRVVMEFFEAMQKGTTTNQGADNVEEGNVEPLHDRVELAQQEQDTQIATHPAPPPPQFSGDEKTNNREMGGLLGFLQQRQRQREQMQMLGVRRVRQNSVTWTRDKLARGAKAVFDFSRRHSLRTASSGRHQNRTSPDEMSEIMETGDEEGQRQQRDRPQEKGKNKAPLRLTGGGTQERYLPQAWVSEFDS